MLQKLIVLEEARHLPPSEDEGCIEAMAGQIVNIMVQLKDPGLDPTSIAGLQARLDRLEAQLCQKTGLPPFPFT